MTNPPTNVADFLSILGTKAAVLKFCAPYWLGDLQGSIVDRPEMTIDDVDTWLAGWYDDRDGWGRDDDELVEALDAFLGSL